MATLSASEMEFIWNDGGRASAGFIGLTGDCVTRSIAIATGTAYRKIYDALGQAAEASPRNGMPVSIASEYLHQAGFECQQHLDLPLEKSSLPKGTVVLHIESRGWRSGHFCTIIDHVVHDTWNPADDDYTIKAMWTPVATDGALHRDGLIPGKAVSQAEQLTQNEFEKILKRLIALDRTATNAASTEGEKRNALRMIQNLMLRHNLSRQDITEDDNTDNVLFTRIACPLNGRRACRWEGHLARFVTDQIFPMVQYYQDRKGNRTFFWFYGPKDDVANCIALFRELLLTIATAAQLRYGGYSRGSGASYCEGYVRGLPRAGDQPEQDAAAKIFSQDALIHARTLALQEAATDWLGDECGIRLVTSRSSGRSRYDANAANQGRSDGAKQDLPAAHRQERLTHHR